MCRTLVKPPKLVAITQPSCHVSLKLRLKYFDAMISPVVLFGLASSPLIPSQVQGVNVVQRRVLRAVVGWVGVDGNDWRDTMRRMNDKVKDALDIFPVSRWFDALFKRQFRFATRITSSNSWPGFATLWDRLDIWRCNFDSKPFRLDVFKAACAGPVAKT